MKGGGASAHRVSCAHDPLKPHPARQDVHSAQEMALIDCSLLTASEAVEGSGRKWRVKTRQFAQWVLVCEVCVVHYSRQCVRLNYCESGKSFLLYFVSHLLASRIAQNLLNNVSAVWFGPL